MVKPDGLVLGGMIRTPLLEDVSMERKAMRKEVFSRFNED